MSEDKFKPGTTLEFITAADYIALGIDQLFDELSDSHNAEDLDLPKAKTFMLNAWKSYLYEHGAIGDWS